MRKNVGLIDKIVRIVLAGTIAALYFFGVISGGLAIALLAIAGIFIITSAVGTCPIYLGLKLSTKKSGSKE